MLLFPTKFNARVIYPFLEWKTGRSILPKLKTIEEHMAKPFMQRKRILAEQLHAMLNFAGEHVPYWRDLFAEIKFDPKSVLDDLSALSQLPYLTKDIILREGSRMTPVPAPPLTSRRTGGSTGPTTLFFYDFEGLDWTAASNLYALSLTGKSMDDTEVHFSTEFKEKVPLKPKLIELCKCQAMNRTNIQTHSLDPAVLQAALTKLMRVRPFLVQGHPSTLYALALFAERTNVNATGAFHVFESTGETLSAKQRETIERIFGGKVFNRYGTAEFGVIAHETASSAAHEELLVIDYMVYPETRPSDEGTQEVVLSGTTNKGMPLFRYCQGDIAELSAREDGWYYGKMVGRIHDMVTINGSTYPTHYIQDLIDNRAYGSVQNFQIVIRPDQLPDFRLVVPNESIREQVKERVLSWWDGNVTVQFVNNEDLISSGWRNKLRYVVWETK